MGEIVNLRRARKAKARAAATDAAAERRARFGRTRAEMAAEAAARARVARVLDGALLGPAGSAARADAGEPVPPVSGDRDSREWPDRRVP